MIGLQSFEDASSKLGYTSLMDRATLLQQLAEAEHHMAEGRRHLTHQETIIAALDRDGHDTTDALALLATMRETQALHQQERDRILRKLDQPERA
jgi:hypothetical protein